MTTSHSLAALIAALLFLSGVSLTFVAKAEPSVPQDCVVTDEYGSQTWIGDLPEPVRAVGNALQEFADSYPHLVTGVAYCSHYEAVTIYVKEHHPAVDEHVATIQDGNPQIPVYTIEVGASLEDIMLAIDSIDLTAEARAPIVAIMPDPSHGGIAIAVDVSRTQIGSNSQLNHDALVAELELEQITLPIRFEPGSPVQETTTTAKDSTPEM